jgi:hypothetical protein
MAEENKGRDALASLDLSPMIFENLRRGHPVTGGAPCFVSYTEKDRFTKISNRYKIKSIEI